MIKTKIHWLLLLGIAAQLVAGCDPGTVSSEGMQESQKKIDAANAKLDGKQTTDQN